MDVQRPAIVWKYMETGDLEPSTSPPLALEMRWLSQAGKQACSLAMFRVSAPTTVNFCDRDYAIRVGD